MHRKDYSYFDLVQSGIIRSNNLTKFLLFTLGVLVFSSLPFAFATTVSWGAGTYFLGDGGIGGAPVQITVNDPSANTTAIDTITAQVSSTSDPTGITLQLTETGAKTAIFKNTNLIFYSGDGLLPLGRTATVTVQDPGANTHPTTSDTLPVVVQSSSDPSGLSLSFSETGINTGIFSGKVTFNSVAASSGSTLKTNQGDEITVRDVDSGLSANALITPNPNAGFGALKAKIGDTVTVSYKGITSSAIIGNSSLPGGGGGGVIINPGLVLDALADPAGLFENIFFPPSIGNDYHNKYGGGLTINGIPFDINSYSTTIQQQVLKIGQPATFTLKMYDERGASAIAHAGMYFHFKGDPIVNNADTWISWDKVNGVDTHDPNKIFNKSSVGIKTDGNYFLVTFALTPQKTMPDSSLIMRMWDDKRAVGDVPVWGAIVIVDPNAPVPVKKIPTNQYSDYVTLEQILDKDGYDIPVLLNKLHTIHDIYNSLDINWVYDKGTGKLTLVESDKSGNILGTIVSSLSKKTSEPAITDHNYFHFTAQQLNRRDVDQESAAKLAEEQKAERMLESLGIVRQNNFETLK